MSNPYPGLKLAQIPGHVGRYPYEKLDVNKSQFRLFLLYPRVSTNSEDIRITIFEDTLDEGQERMVPTFQALSYVWGDATEKLDIMVIVPTRGVNAICKLSVTASLAEALVHYPYRDKHVVLWVDAICINQEDHIERAQQVSLMHKIYSQAHVVTAWLGPEADNSNLALSLLTRIGETVEFDLINPVVTINQDSTWLRKSPMDNGYTRLLLDPNFPIPWHGPEAQAIEALFDRTWFERLWIRQEVSLGGDRTVLLCGQSSIMWTTFRKAAFVLARKAVDDAHPNKAKWTLKTHLVSRIWRHGKSSLQSLMSDLRRTECSEEKDRVYGALGILPFDSTSILQTTRPNYSKTVVEVYQDFILADISTNGRADLLVECYTPDTKWSPSWVPNWTARTKFPITVLDACADGQSTVTANLCADRKTLTIKGKLAAMVSCVWEPLLAPESYLDRTEQTTLAAINAIKVCAGRLELDRQYPGGGDFLDALCFSLSGGRVAENMSLHLKALASQSIAQYKACVEFARNFGGSHSEVGRLNSDLNINGCIDSAKVTLQDHMIITEEGYLGFSPVTVRPGDCVCVLLGCMKPIILRPTTVNTTGGTTSEIPNYTVVGPCFVYGIEWGEALLGPLPDDVAFIWNLSGPNGSCGPAFRNRKTGGETIVDPRIDWDSLRLDTKERAFVYRTLIGSGRTDYFRRPDADYFQGIGIKLTDFCLV